jgi:aspartate/methionine/tyrosine aminotransferase
MFPRTRYLEWARRFYGQVRCDLASSGAATVPLSELGLPPLGVLDDPSGWDALRAGIATYNDVPASEAVAALGTTHAIWLAYTALTSPGDAVLVERPSYEPLWRIPEGLGLAVHTFERSAAHDFSLDPDRVAASLTPRTKVVAISNLHNPGGVRAGDEELRAVAHLAEQHGATLLVDEVYAPFDALVDAEGVFRGSARKLAPNVVAVGSLTKAYGLGPQRIGWVLGSADVVARADDAITASAGVLPLLHAHLGAHAFTRVCDLADRTRSALQGKRERVAAWVERQGLTWSRPSDGLFGFVHLQGHGDLFATLEAAAREHEVLVTPGAFFGQPEGFRLAWSAPMAVLAEGLDTLGRVLAELAR